MDWKRKHLLDVCDEITAGGAAPQGESFFSSDGISFVRVVDMGRLNGGKYILQTRDSVNAKGAEKLRLFPSGTVLFTKSGASLLLNQRAILKQPMYVVSHIGCLIPDKNSISAEWLYYWMKTVDFGHYAHATTLPSLKLSALKELVIPVPPLPEQERIVSRIEELFSQLDAGVETLKKTKAQLAVYRQAVYSAAYKEIKETKPITAFFDVTGGLTKNNERNQLPIKMPYLRVANVYYNFLDLSEIKEIGVTESEIERMTLQKSDLLFVEGNGSKSQIGRVAIWDGNITPCLHQNHIIKARPMGNMLPEFALFFLISNGGRKQIVDVAKSTSGLYTLSTNKVKNLQLPSCDIDRQEIVVNTIKERLSDCDSIERTVDTALRQSESLRQSILKSAFEGRL